MQPYTYKFNANNCMYKSICGDINTENCNAVCERFMITDFLLHHSNIPVKQRQRIKFENRDKDIQAYNTLYGIRNNIVEFVNNGENIYIYSDITRNGKTSWAISLMLKYFDRIWQGNGFKIRGVFVSVPIFLLNCKNAISKPDNSFEQFKQTLRDADLVIWDNIATTNLSNYDSNLLYAYISERLINKKSNIFTGYLDEYHSYQCLGEILAPCIWENGDSIQFKAESWKY